MCVCVHNLALKCFKYLWTCPEFPPVIQNASRCLDPQVLQGSAGGDKKSLCLFHSLHGDYKPTIAGKNCFLAAFLYIAGWWFGTCFMTFHILGMSSSQLTNSYFSEGLKPPTRLGVWSCFLEDLLDHERSTLHVGDPFLPGRSVSYVCFVPSNRCTTGNHALWDSTSAWVNTP